MTLKIYADSVNSKKKLFILDSGAINKDSRGISVWVVDGKIKALVATRQNVACISKDLTPWADQWIVMTVTWRKDKGWFSCIVLGLLLYLTSEFVIDEYTTQRMFHALKSHA